MSKRFNRFSNDPKNWNVKQGVGARNVGILLRFQELFFYFIKDSRAHILKRTLRALTPQNKIQFLRSQQYILPEHPNSLHLCGTNASKHKSRVSLLKYCLIVFIKSNLAMLFITASQASGRANFSSLEPFEIWSPKKNIESDSLASVFLNDLNNTPKDHKNGNTAPSLPVSGDKQQLAYQRAVYRLHYSVSDNNTNANTEYIVGMIKATEASIEKVADDFKREKYLRKRESKNFKIKKKGRNSNNKRKHLNKGIENLNQEVSISFNNIPSPTFFPDSLMNYWEGGFNSQRLDSPRVTDNKNIVQNDLRYQEREFEAPSTVASITNLIQQDKSADNIGKPTEQEPLKEVLPSSSPIACSSLLLTTSTPSSQDVLIGASRRKRSMPYSPLISASFDSRLRELVPSLSTESMLMSKDETTESIETHREGESSSNICSSVDDKSSLLSDAQILTKDKSRTLSAREALLLPDSKSLKNLPSTAVSTSLHHVTGETVILDNSFLEVADGALIRVSTPNPEQAPYTLQDIRQKDKLTIPHAGSPQGIDNNAIARRTENISTSTELLTSPILPFSNNRTLADLDTDNSYHMPGMDLSASSVTTSLEDLPEENPILSEVNIENAAFLRSNQLNNLGDTTIMTRQPINTHDIESPDNVKSSKREVILAGNEPPLAEEISSQSLADPLGNISLPSTVEGSLPPASSLISESTVEERRVETIPLESAPADTEIPPSTEALGSSVDEWRQRVTPICNNEGTTERSSGSPLSDKPKILQNYTNLEISNREVIKRRFNLYNIWIHKIALSAGENNLNIQRGLWVSVLYGYINQGLSNNIAGYTGHNRGGSIGFDVEINNNLIGLAYSNIHSMFKFKDNTNKARERATSHIFSIYGQTNLSHNFTLQGLALIARNYVKNNTFYLLNNSQYHLTEKYRVSNYSVETLLNYHYLTKHNLILIPNIGLRYGFAYYAMHNNPHNLLNNSRSRNMTTGIIGTKLLLPFRRSAGSPLISLALQGAIEYNFNPKVQYILKTINIANQEQTKPYIIPKPPKTAYNIGVSLVTDIQNIQISLEYHYHLYKHYYNHQGSITFKLNF